MSEKMLVKELLLSSNYWVLNKTVVQTFGIETAFLLTNLAEAEQMMSTEDGWFYQTSDTLEELTTLSRYKQDNAIEQLEDAGILEKDVRGIPAKRYFRLDYKALANKIVNNSQTSVQENDKQVFKKLATNKERTINKVNRESNKDHSPAKAEQSIPYKEVIDYLNEQTGRRYSHTANKNQDLIRARWNEGFRVDDFKRVVDTKVKDWGNDSKMNQYLRPVTLFSNKFDDYLNQSVIVSTETKPSGNNYIEDWSEFEKIIEGD